MKGEISISARDSYTDELKDYIYMSGRLVLAVKWSLGPMIRFDVLQPPTRLSQFGKKFPSRERRSDYALCGRVLKIEPCRWGVEIARCSRMCVGPQIFECCYEISDAVQRLLLLRDRKLAAVENSCPRPAELE